MTRERPILFSGTMVMAILEGRKTQTRRICTEFKESFVSDAILTKWPQQIGCRYGEVGDRLWIKTGYSTRYDERLDTTYWSIDSGFVTTHGKPLSKSGKQKRDGRHPGMFMPFWLSQQLALPTLEITGVRVDRLQDISESDAMAEGCPECNTCSDRCGMWGRGAIDNPLSLAAGGKPFSVCDGECNGLTATEWFQELWQSINGSESWASNPWVWVIEFRRVET